MSILSVRTSLLLNHLFEGNFYSCCEAVCVALWRLVSNRNGVLKIYVINYCKTNCIILFVLILMFFIRLDVVVVVYLFISNLNWYTLGKSVYLCLCTGKTKVLWLCNAYLVLFSKPFTGLVYRFQRAHKWSIHDTDYG
jgi:hypothetical protein